MSDVFDLERTPACARMEDDLALQPSAARVRVRPLLLARPKELPPALRDFMPKIKVPVHLNSGISIAIRKP